LDHEISSYSLNLNWDRKDVYPIFNYVKEYNFDLNKTNNPFLKKKYIDSHISKIIEISKNYDLVINTLNNVMWPKKIHIIQPKMAVFRVIYCLLYMSDILRNVINYFNLTTVLSVRHVGEVI
jgi:hypothetical protein